ncbi:MAG: phage major tail tube protein [Selenomonadaceae bacterium]|nr:phage major tail tube protein [Selenomonadaceae bacterium]
MATNMVNEMINDWRVYEEGKDNFIGATSIEVSGLSTKTADISGIGLAGEISAPVEGHFESIEVKINWRVPTQKAIVITGGQTIALEIYGAIQNFDGGESKHIYQQLKITVRGCGKNYEGGTLEAMNTTDSANTIEAHYLKYEVDGKETLVIDKYNYVFRVNGKDFMESIRRTIGMN